MLAQFQLTANNNNNNNNMEHPREHPNGRHATFNPYQRYQQSLTSAQMGPQSQRRLTLEDRTHELQASSHRKRKAGQFTLFGSVVFDLEKNCVVCKAKLASRASHKGHHPLCTNNRQTQGVISQATLKQNKIDKQLKNISRLHWQNLKRRAHSMRQRRPLMHFLQREWP